MAVEQLVQQFSSRDQPFVVEVNQEIVEMILARNDRCLEELERLKLSGVDLCLSKNPHNLFFLSLMKASKQWKVDVMFIDSFKDIWMMLAHISKVGRIGCLIIQLTGPLSLDAADREHLRKVWEISKQVGFLRPVLSCVFFRGGMSTQPLELWGGTLEENWQSVLQLVQKGRDGQQEGGAA